MEKIDINSLKGKVIKLLNRGEVSNVYLMSDGRVLKLFNEDILFSLNMYGINMCDKIKDAETRIFSPVIVKPESMVYNKGNFIGYIMPFVKGISYSEWDEGLSLEDRINLKLYADVFSRIEKVVRAEELIVFPDICTCSNIILDKCSEGLDVHIIDYEGHQIDGYPSISFSTTLGDMDDYFGTKYMYNYDLYTKELDIKSMILLYFLTAFNIDLNKIGQINPYTLRVVTMEDIFGCINLDNPDIMHKVWKLFQNNEKNEWLGDDVFDLAYRYRLLINPNPISKGRYIKRLVKK